MELNYFMRISGKSSETSSVGFDIKFHSTLFAAEVTALISINGGFAVVYQRRTRINGIF